MNATVYTRKSMGEIYGGLKRRDNVGLRVKWKTEEQLKKTLLTALPCPFMFLVGAVTIDLVRHDSEALEDPLFQLIAVFFCWGPIFLAATVLAMKMQKWLSGRVSESLLRHLIALSALTLFEMMLAVFVLSIRYPMAAVVLFLPNVWILSRVTSCSVTSGSP